jgi:beta-lactamase regulating signal transducer with metallopeptidase domain
MDWFAELPVDVIVEALLHHLWQGAVIALLLFVVLKCLPGRQSTVRYGVCLLAMGLACLAVPLSIAVLQYQAGQRATISPGAAEQSQAQMETVDILQTGMPASRGVVPVVHDPDPVSEWGWRQICFSLWLLGSLIGVVRVIAAVSGARRLRQGAARIAAERFARVFEQLGMRRRVPILSSAELSVAAVCGILKPVVLLPLSQLTALSPEQLEAIVAHELAHIRRWDPIVNFFQLIAEALLFFNPCLWWISGQVRAEREACCDAVAVEATGQTSTYIRTLVNTAEGLDSSGMIVAPSFAGDHRSASLLTRVKRILQPSSTPDLHLRMPVVLGLIGLSVVAIAVFQLTAKVAVQLLTPEERIAEIAELQAIYPDYRVRLPAEDGSADPEFIVSGQFLLPGAEVPKERISLYTYSGTRGGNTYAAQRTESDGRFEFRVGKGDYQLMAKYEGLAPLYHDFGYVEKNVEDVVLEFTEGTEAQVRFVNERGEALEGVEIQGEYDLPPGQNIRFSAATDSAGIAFFEHVAPHPVNLKTKLAGYQDGGFQALELLQGGVLELQLFPTKPTVIQIIDGQTGEPLAGADLNLVGVRSTINTMTYGSGPYAGVSDPDGQLLLDGLRLDSHYYYASVVDGYAGPVLGPVAAGETQVLSLLPVQPVSFELIGIPADWLDENGMLTLNIAPTLQVGDGGHTQVGEAQTIEVVDGVCRFKYLPRYQSEIRVRLDEVEFVYQWQDIVKTEGMIVEELTLSEERSVSGEQQIRVRFTVPEGQPSVNGSVRVTYQKYARIPSARPLSASQAVEVVEGVARFSVSAPNQVRFYPDGLPGYWFPQPNGRFSEDVPYLADGSVYEIEVAAEPSGAIFGDVLEADGSPGRAAHISVFVAEVEDNPMQGRALRVDVKNSSSSHDRSDRYLASPLPLGGIYVMSVSRKFTYVLSEPIEVSAETPLRKCDFVLPVGETVTGRLLDSKGEPVAYQPTRFQFDPELGHGFSSDGPITDAAGRFKIEGVNFDVDGTYYVEVKQVAGHQPDRLKLKSSKREQTLQLKQGHRIVGVVREASTGRVIPGAELYAVRTDAVEGVYPTWFECANSDAQGRFEFNNLPEGTFDINTRSGRRSGRSDSRGTTDTDSEVEVKINLYEWSDLIPVDAK